MPCGMPALIVTNDATLSPVGLAVFSKTFVFTPKGGSLCHRFLHQILWGYVVEAIKRRQFIGVTGTRMDSDLSPPYSPKRDDS